MRKEENYIYGRNAVIEALRNDSVEKVFLMFGAQGSAINKIYSLAKKSGTPITKYDKHKFIRLEKDVCPKPNIAQGVIALSKLIETEDLNSIVEKAFEKEKAPVLVALDGITDPQNFGAIARTAECAGASGILIPERNSSPINSVALKASAGALENVKVARVGNIATELENLKEKGFWIVGTSLEAEQSYTDDIYGTPTVLVIGSEGKGMGHRVTKVCDHLVKIEMNGTTQSLNASVSAGIMLFEILRQRRISKGD